MGRLFAGLIAPLLFFSTSANAVLFDVALTDKSLYYLGMIFGQVGSLPIAGADSMIGNIFVAFNQIFITLTFVILSYVGLISVLQTAQEGKVLGQKWSGMIVPVRAGMGIFMLIPDSTGYSNIQQLFMWLILSGVGAANTMWTKVVTYADSAGGVTFTKEYDPATQLSSNRVVLRTVLTQMLSTLICAEMVNNNPEDFENKSSLLPKLSTFPQSSGAPEVGLILTPYRINVNYVNMPGSANAICGYVSPPDFKAVLKTSELTKNLNSTELDTVANAFRDEYLSGLYEIMTILQGISRDVYEEIFALQAYDNSFRIGFGDSFVTTRQLAAHDYVTTGVMPTITLAYNKLAQVYRLANKNSHEFKEKLSTVAPTKIEDIVQSPFLLAIQDGWIHGGSFYYTIIRPAQTAEEARKRNETKIPLPYSRISMGSIDSMKSDFKMQDKDEQILVGNFYNQYRELIAANIITLEAGAFSPPPRNINVGDNTELMEKKLHSSVQDLGTFRDDMLDWFKFMGAERSDGQVEYIVNIAYLGTILVADAEMAFVVFAVINAALMLGIAIGTGCQGAGLALDMAIQFVSGLVSVFIMMLYVAGAMMAFYLPIVPFLFYTFAAVGWIISVIEAMVAAPLVGMYIATPSQDELGRVQNALIILIHAFLKPTLIVVGFVVAAKLLNIAFDLLLTAILPGLKSAVAASGFFGAFGVVFMFASFVTMMANKAFQVIYQLPDRVIRWIGGQGDGYGDGADGLEGKFKGVAEQTGQKMGAAAKYSDQGKKIGAKIKKG